jgi:hypothetical protein
MSLLNPALTLPLSDDDPNSNSTSEAGSPREMTVDEDDLPAEVDLDLPSELVPNQTIRPNRMATGPQGNNILLGLQTNLGLSEADLQPVEHWTTVRGLPFIYAPTKQS